MGSKSAQLLHDDFEQELMPKSLAEFLPLRRNKTETVAHLDELWAAIAQLNVRTSVPSHTRDGILTLMGFMSCQAEVVHAYEGPNFCVVYVRRAYSLRYLQRSW